MKHLFLWMCLLLVVQQTVFSQAKEPWTNSQLMATKTLADKITSNQTKDLLVLNVGPDALIKGSIDIGAAHDAGSLQKLKDYLKNVKKDKAIVIYCGCCPFDRCPNVRPAFQTLMDMGFKNAKLLDVPKNLKVDWIDKQYPTVQ
ncbi:hypothetical protein LX64_01303 [Chitinophaga skermanii]|uniref:Rhodanese domain-containing protein n=1 Tax=Chitinophaga skermanii TaxID=331697 RepID=A0A327QVM1_9BACT|nr:rhodanese-like domain-containing protein [Chitinophaga skermanii]RAJ08649.1 hypothetical protein LX64_01303 [Chitinophaga skermanii]